MIKDKLSILRQIELEIKIGIIIIDIIMTLYVLWLIITNSSTWLVGVLFGFTPFGVFELIRAGKLFNLCICHKLMLFHIMAVYCCCIYQAYIGFGDTLAIMRWITFIIGFILLLLVLFKKCQCYE